MYRGWGGTMSDHEMLCPECDVEHSEWSDAGTTTTGPDSRGVLDLWDCERCGYTLEGVRL